MPTDRLAASESESKTFEGKPCGHPEHILENGCSVRFASNDKCVLCRRRDLERYRQKLIALGVLHACPYTPEQKAIWKGNLRSAAEKGETHFDGRPCKQCGNTKRYVKSNHQCVECGRRWRNDPGQKKLQEEYDKQWYQTNKVRKNAYDVEYREANREIMKQRRQEPTVKARAALLGKLYLQSIDGKRVRKKAYLLLKYNMTMQTWDYLISLQTDICPVCEEALDVTATGMEGIAVDHDHDCCPGHTSCGDCIRGLVHKRCNIGHQKDDPRLHRNKATYLPDVPLCFPPCGQPVSIP